MQVTATQLNQIAELLGTTDKNTVITFAIGTLVQAGINISEAFDAVLGAGAYVKFAGDLYHALTSI